jgi:hypothetical protein
MRLWHLCDCSKVRGRNGRNCKIQCGVRHVHSSAPRFACPALVEYGLIYPLRPLSVHLKNDCCNTCDSTQARISGSLKDCLERRSVPPALRTHFGTLMVICPYCLRCGFMPVHGAFARLRHHLLDCGVYLLGSWTRFGGRIKSKWTSGAPRTSVSILVVRC